MVAAGVAILLNSWNRPTVPSEKLLELRNVADQVLADYLKLRDQRDAQYQAAVEADGGDPQKMLEINKKFAPLNQQIKELNDKYMQAWQKALDQSNP
ncbi:MAG TPA: hypothetical protein VFE46_09230 [Pirellulales bacterium]|nr:hypothetical protein [Pirellulales bacterium]